MTSDGLEVQEVTVRFGGLTAADGVSLHGRAGAITGLVGPNGAGKTTLFNVCTGVVRPSSGAVFLDGRRLDRRAPAARAQLGLGRTFQQLALFDNLSVADNVALGYEARRAGEHWWKQLRSSRPEQLDAATATAAALERCGLTDQAAAPVRDLSTGEQRLVELARVLAAGFRYLLLDEPSSGLDDEETGRLGAVLTDVADEGTGILLVEHDLTLVRAICAYTYVLDFGRVLTEGPTDDVLASALVHDAYLGSVDPD